MGKIEKVDIDYSDPHNYEYLIKNFISTLIPIKIDNDSWDRAEFFHYSESKNSVSSQKKFDIDIKLESADNKHFLIFTSNENKLKLPIKDINYKFTICGAIKEIHNAMVSIPLEHKNRTFSEQYIDSIYNSSVQIGICSWLHNNLIGGGKENSYNEQTVEKKGVLFYKIIDSFEEWAQKTYEGNSVSFGILIDRNDMNSNDTNIEYLSFIKSNDFAPITNIPNSLIKLDKNGYIKEYISIDEKNCDIDYIKHPIQLREIVKICNKNLKSSKSYIAILLLTNSEIVIIKNDVIEWVKRNGRWFNYNDEYLKKCLEDTLKDNSNLINHFYSAILNLSFAKTGGCLTIIKKEKLNDFKGKFNNDNWFDNLELSEEYIQNKLNGIDKESKPFYVSKINKRNTIKNLVKATNFCNINQQLLLELASMDGASIIDEEGKIIAFSSIVNLTLRGDGGGRSAAAKSLSMYGISVKVSTDGYFEIYENGNIIYSLK